MEELIFSFVDPPNQQGFHEFSVGGRRLNCKGREEKLTSFCTIQDQSGCRRPKSGQKRHFWPWLDFLDLLK